MRKFNMILSMAILLLFLVHGITGAYNLMGLTTRTTSTLAWIMVVLIGIHVVIGIILTVQTLTYQHKAGVSYPRQNRLFWARRISGFVIMLLIFAHIAAFAGFGDGPLRLPYFDVTKLILQILLVISIGFHIITNAKPMLLGFGVARLRVRANDVAFWTSVILLVMAIAFVIYFIRWSTI